MRGTSSEGPGEEDGSGDAVFECECEAEKAGEADEEVVGFAGGFDEDAFFGGLGEADPEEVETLEAVVDEAAFVGADLLVGEFAFAADVGGFAHLAVLLEDGAGFADGDGRSPGEALMFGEDGLMELGTEVAAHWDEGVEDGVVADRPWGDAGEGEYAGKSAAKKRSGAVGLWLCSAPSEHPQAADRDEREGVWS